MLASSVTVADTQRSVRAEMQHVGVMVSGNNLFAELKRRNVLRAATFYAAAAWLLVQVSTQVFPFFHIPEWVVRWIVMAAIVGFPFALVASWFYEWTPHGFVRESDANPSPSLPIRCSDYAIVRQLHVLGTSALRYVMVMQIATTRIQTVQRSIEEGRHSQG
jgi:hypothetical protein